VNYFGGASVAALLVSYTRTIDFAALSIIVPLLVISYLTYKTSLGRVEDAMQHLDEVNRLYMSTIETLATAIDAKDQVTHGHIRRVQRFALGLAEKLGMTEGAQLRALEAAALLHDMGKIAVPEHILNKPTRLTRGEFEKMKLHASVGADILSSVPFPYPVVPIVRHHHENWDGSGYPNGLRGTEIPLGARILAVVDCFDALTSDRPYRPRLPDEEAMRVLVERRGTMYDPLVVDRFIAVKDELAKLSTEAVPGNVEDLVKEPLREATGCQDAFHNAVLAHFDLRQALRTVLTVVNEETRALLSVVYVKVPHRDELVIADAFGFDGEQLVGSVLPLGSRISGWVAANGRSIVNSDARIELPGSCEFAKDLLCAAVPIAVSGDVMGVVAAFRRVSRPFTDSEIGYLERVASRLSEEPLRSVVFRALDPNRFPESTCAENIH
jgi:putative nucleotidyltransferase with HDIG domain